MKSTMSSGIGFLFVGSSSGGGLAPSPGPIDGSGTLVGSVPLTLTLGSVVGAAAYLRWERCRSQRGRARALLLEAIDEHREVARRHAETVTQSGNRKTIFATTPGLAVGPHGPGAG